MLMIKAKGRDKAPKHLEMVISIKVNGNMTKPTVRASFGKLMVTFTMETG
jgi:hypothetical protein